MARINPKGGIPGVRMSRCPVHLGADTSVKDNLVGRLLSLSVNAIIMIDAGNSIVTFNVGAERVFGWPADAILGKSLELLLPLRARGFHHNYVEKYREGAIASRMMGESMQVVGLHRSGREFPADVTIIRSEDGHGYCAALVRDLTEEVKAREALEKSERRLRSAQQIADIGYWDWDLSQGRSNLTWSPEMFRIFGIKAGDFDGTFEAFLKRVHPDDQKKVRKAFLDTLDYGDDYQIEHRIIRPDGGICTLLERGVVQRDDKGRPAFVEGTAQDISFQKETQSSLIEAKNAALAASAAKSQFLTTMGHELRTPLNAIGGFSQMMMSEAWGALDSRYREYAGLILQAAEHLTGIINMILDASRIEAGRMKLNEEFFNLNELLVSSAQLLQVEAQRWRKTLTVHLAPERLIYADKQMIRQVIFNLVVNALKFSPPNSPVDIECTLDFNGGLIISVIDQGPGIDSSIIEKPMRPFVQGDNRLSRRHDGLGLGLYLVDSFVQAHDGKLEFTRPIEGGTVVQVILPAFRVSETNQD